jgi:hypothetical protein
VNSFQEIWHLIVGIVPARPARPARHARHAGIAEPHEQIAGTTDGMFGNGA